MIEMFMKHIDQYCERIDFSLLSEPVNVITNLSFILAAWLLYKQCKKTNVQDKEVFNLITLIAIIGIGSAAFHVFANFISMLADVIPIVFFVIYFLFVAQRNYLGVSKKTASAGLGAFFVLAWLVGQVPADYTFNGSISYFPCLAVLLLLGSILNYKKHSAAQSFFNASGLFIISLIFRSVDMAVCNSFPLGTHFLWHLLNGAVLYSLTRGMLEYKSVKVN